MLAWTFWVKVYVTNSVLAQTVFALLDIDRRQNMWVTWANQTGQDSFCLSLATPSNPFHTCLIGVPVESMMDFKAWTQAQIFQNINDAWNTWCMRPLMHFSPHKRYENWCKKHNISKNALGAQAALVAQNLKTAGPEPQELDLLGSVPSKYCLFFGYPIETYPKNSSSWVSPKSSLYYNYPEYCSNWTQSINPITRVPKQLPPGIFLICGDRAWSALPRRAAGGPCYFGKLTLFAPSIHQVLGLSQSTQRVKRSVSQLGPECTDKVILWGRPAVILSSFFAPGVASAQALTQLRTLACWTKKQINITTSILSELAADVGNIRHSVLQNRAAIDFLLLSQGHGCEEFEGMCCMNLSDHSQSIYKQLAQLRNNLKKFMVINTPFDQWFNSWSLTGWVKDLVRFSIICVCYNAGAPRPSVGAALLALIRVPESCRTPLIATSGAESRDNLGGRDLRLEGRNGSSGRSDLLRKTRGTPQEPASGMEALAKDMLIGRPRNAYMPLPEDGDTPPNRQTAPEKPTRVRPMHQRYVCVILLLGLVARGQASPDYYPHQPFRWVMRHLTSDKVLRDITTPNTPSFVLRITDLFPGQPKVDPYSPHSSHMYLSYWCPASNAGKSYCNYPGWGYCGYWGCETIVTDARPSGPGWDPREPDKFLQFTWAPAGCKTPLFVHGNSYRNSYKIPKFRKCTYYNMTVLQPNHPSWAVGKAWTVVLHGSKEWVNVRIIRLQPSASRAVGPNKIIKSTQTKRNTTYPKTLPTSITKIPTSDAKAFQIDRLTRSDPDPILRMLEATFLSLNESNPNLTNSCWLCYDVQPPFYEGVALNTPFSYSTADAPHQCRWDTPRRGITLNQVTGRGKCFGNATLAKRKGNVCTKVEKPSRKNNKWAVPSESAMWVCQRSGVSPCVFLPKFDDSNDFCVQVLIVPRVLYHSDEEVYNLFEESGRLHKREIMTSITIAMLLSLGAAGTATGVSALATQHQGLSQLQMTIDEDLQRIEKSISYLEKSVSSLSEVVLQNRRGLDLLFMQQGGLCAALKEECCFYADHTGVVRDSMAELRNRLAQRQKDREAQQGWFESWFNQSPWLTTLISTLVGPLAMLLLAVTFGPCLLNKIVSFVKARLEQTNILFIGQHEML
ncbi:uncharacterized protein FYW23_001115 [Sylvia borin]